MPNVLVTGIHRSGTSVLSHLLARVTGLTLLDDPQWAVGSAQDILSYRHHGERLRDMLKYEIVKCPRMCEHLCEVMSDFPGMRVTIALRDPRDVWASVIEKVKLRRPTRMLDNERFGAAPTPLDGFLLQAKHCYRKISETTARYPNLVRVVIYEDFCEDKQIMINNILGWLRYECISPLAQADLNKQYGPLGHKRQPYIIHGTGRWTTDISEEEADTIWASLGARYMNLRGLARV